MGEVFLAEDVRLNRRVALKCLPPNLVGNAEIRERFQREAQALAALNHRHVVQIFEVSEHEGWPYFVMEWIDGQSLSEVARRGLLPLSRVMEIVTEAAEGLAAVHGAQVVHRDMKPSNLMVDAEGSLKILDFGLAKQVDDRNVSRAGSTLGTLSYMSPEQVRGEDLDQRSDLFSFGIILYELVTGHRPFKGAHPAEVARNIVERPPTPPGVFRSGLPGELLHILSKCFEKDVDLRYQSATEVLADLRRLRRELAGGRPDLVATEGVEGSPVRSETEFAGGRGTTAIPALPPLPSKPTLVLLSLLALALVALSTRWTSGTVRPYEMIHIDSVDAEHIARDFLESLDVNLFGYRYYTRPRIDPLGLNVVLHEKLSEAEWSELLDWSPALSFVTIAASADHQDKYRISTGPTGYIHRVHHLGRADSGIDSLSTEAAARRAEGIMETMLGDRESGLEPLPMVSRLVGGIVQREFHWQDPELTTAGAYASLAVTLHGTRLLDADAVMNYPPTLVRTVEQKRDPSGVIGGMIFFSAIVIAIVLAIRHRWFTLPNWRLGVILALVWMATEITNSQTIRWAFVSEGAGALLSETGKIFAGIVVFSILIYLLIGLCHGILKVNRPELIPGLGGATDLRVPRSVWQRSAAVGLPIGALAAILPDLYSHAVLSLSGIDSIPLLSDDLVLAPIATLGPILTGTVVEPVALILGFACITVLQEQLRLGKWAWVLALLAGAAVYGASFFTLSDRLDLMNLCPLITVGLVLWCGYRFGLLAAIVGMAALYPIDVGLAQARAQPVSYRANGWLWLLIWAALLVISLIGVLRTDLRSRGHVPAN